MKCLQMDLFNEKKTFYDQQYYNMTLCLGSLSFLEAYDFFLQTQEKDYQYRTYVALIKALLSQDSLEEAIQVKHM